ncbi:MAG: SRPBCC domain-containing protein [Alphaproteobacteria bacterium]|nr:SRPBCC domain-containing protein [Alphaproteobacteria bacterium]
MSSPFETSVTLRCSVEHAFDVFITKVDLWWPRSHRRFEHSTFSMEARAGGRLVERAADGSEMVFGDVLVFERPNCIRMTWHPGKVSQPTEVTISFAQEDGRTTVRVVHTEGASELGPQWDEKVALFSKGWSAILAALGDFTRVGEGEKPRPTGHQTNEKGKM